MPTTVSVTQIDTTTGKERAQESTAGAGHVTTVGTAPTSVGAIKTTATAPATTTAAEAIATGSRSLAYKNLSATTAQYCLLGFGTSIVDAETNRDAGQMVCAAGESAEVRIPTNATHYAWKSASGTPSLWIGQGV